MLKLRNIFANKNALLNQINKSFFASDAGKSAAGGFNFGKFFKVNKLSYEITIDVICFALTE